MKISIVTATMNDYGGALERNFAALRSQTFRDFEHIVVDSGKDSGLRSDDGEGWCTYCRCHPRGVYNAINIGISKASGDIVGLVHGSDCLDNPGVLQLVADEFATDRNLDFIYANVAYYNYDNIADGHLVRQYGGGRFVPSLLRRGFAPPHPSLFIRRDVALAVGPYAEDYKVAADFEMWLRLFSPERRLRYKYLPETFVRMTTGGISTKLSNVLSVNIKEKIKALHAHGIRVNLFALMFRYFYLMNPMKNSDGRK